jgi:hypothetical protein
MKKPTIINLKTRFAILLGFLFFIAIACNQKVDIEKETKAIKSVIEEETAAFLARDFERLAKTHLQDETTARVDLYDSAYILLNGWKAIGDTIKSMIKINDLVDSKPTFSNSDYHIKIYPESAWAVFLQKAEYDYRGKHYVEKAINTRFLEKKDGKWKIVYISYVNKYDENK